jgi:ATP-binding cassette, subfamily B, bacterial HlyB/CyaB
VRACGARTRRRTETHIFLPTERFGLCVLRLALRIYVFAHTTNRIDVELGVRLFKHLIALPIAYFEARRAGDSVARLRELENIRNILTSSALTLVIDLGFTFVFLAAMFYYSPLLSWIVVGSFPFYIALSASVTPVFRQRLEKKFDRGAENQPSWLEVSAPSRS